ncbi:hypothetical protein D9757_007028 [Collybiopsis confluens]|uniref:Uncharacterized protein n=1 Tax=Collybiopsis confluens TaxID=2823264 RepID=A0A8H5M4Q9_9AGAR|nr:hypothetical protein D9757_007028 [Collybiopsis confluens]
MEYSTAVELRSPSPASSVGSIHPDDQTSQSDSEEMLSQPRFEQKWENLIGLGQTTQRETEAINDPLLPRPHPGSEEERLSHERIVLNLRHQINQLRENEMFEKTLLQGSKAAMETPVHTRDIDVIMRSMMGPSSFSPPPIPPFPSATSTPFVRLQDPSMYRASSAHVNVTNGPWNNPQVTRGVFGGGVDSDSFTRASSPVGRGHGGNASDMMLVMPPQQVSPGMGRKTKARATSRR